MTTQQAADRMREIRTRGGIDIERDHFDADDLLCEILIELGYGEVVAEYDAIKKWYA